MNNKERVTEIICVISIFYTIISIINASLALFLRNRDYVSAFNQIDILLWCTIGTVTIYMHRFFDRWSPLFMIITQYLCAMGLIFLSIYINGLFAKLHPDAYIDGFRSFTIPYVIGASLYYTHLYEEAKRQNNLLQEVKANKKP